MNLFHNKTKHLIRYEKKLGIAYENTIYFFGKLISNHSSELDIVNSISIICFQICNTNFVLNTYS
jgi:hypothetical protein